MSLAVHLVSDLDGTWFPAEGDDGALRALEAFLASHPETVLTFATGRTLDSALDALDRTVRTYPRHLVTDVGTAIHHRSRDGGWVEDADYGQWVAARWSQPAAEGLLLSSLPPEVKRQTHLFPQRRLALHAASGTALPDAVRALAEALDAAKLRADVLASEDGCLDVLPEGVNKGSAVQHLARRREIPPTLVVCGDGRNDVEMLRLADVPVIMSGGVLHPDSLGLSADRVVQTSVPGPAGILDVLRRLEAGSMRPA